MLTAHVSSAQAAENTPKNVLRLRFDTLAVLPGTNDVFVNVYYTFDAPKPHDFRGYNAHFFFDSTKTRILDFFTEGTASHALGYQEFNPKPPEAAAVTLNDPGHEIDFSSPVLFKFRISLPLTLTDTAFFTWDYVDIPDYFGVDSIILENGWVRVQRPSVPVELSTPRASIQADSLLSVPVLVSDLTEANLRTLRLTIHVDSSKLHFEGATAGLHMNVTAASALGSEITVDLDAKSGETVSGSGMLATLLFRALPRIDTVSTKPSDLTLRAFNSDALLGTVHSTTDSIVVYGFKKPDTVVSSVQSPDRLMFRVYPNPVVGSLHVETGLESTHLFTVYDASGSVVAAHEGRDWTWNTAGIATGSYFMRAVEQRTGRMQVASVQIVR